MNPIAILNKAKMYANKLNDDMNKRMKSISFLFSKHEGDENIHLTKSDRKILKNVEYDGGDSATSAELEE